MDGLWRAARNRTEIGTTGGAVKLELARVLGAELVLDPENAGRTLQKQCGGADAAIVLTKSVAAVQQAFRALKRTAILILVGLATEQYALPLVDTVLKGIQIRGSYLGTTGDLHEVFRLAEQGIVRPQVQIHALQDTPELLEKMSRGAIVGRAVIAF
jgi:propanol-preferring alcohol dehydrogenase